MSTTEQAKLKATIYGKSGTGKTALGCTAPKPLYLLSESQALLTITYFAGKLGIERPGIVPCKTVSDVQYAIDAGYSHRPGSEFVVYGFGKSVIFRSAVAPETYVFDSITDIGFMMQESIDVASPPRVGRDGLPARAMNAWGVLGDKGTNLIRKARDLPFHVLFLCLLDDKEIGDEGSKEHWIGPTMPMMRLSNALPPASNIVGIAKREQRRRDVGGKIKTEHRYRVQFAAPEHCISKTLPQLEDIEKPDFGLWIEKVFDISK